LNIAKSWLNDENSDKYILSAEGTSIRAFSKHYADRIKIIGTIADILHKSERNMPVRKQNISTRGCYRQGNGLT